MSRSLAVISEIKRCTVCAQSLPLGPKPLVAGTRRSKILIIGQSPGLAAHESGVPWNDASGDRLRTWLGLSREQFYDDELVALMPMGFCYPGKGRTGDAPPRPECAPLWHDRTRTQLHGVRMTLYVGRYAFDRYLRADFKDITEAALSPARLLPDRCALPHPSPLNNRWLARHREFEGRVIPKIQRAVNRTLGG